MPSPGAFRRPARWGRLWPEGYGRPRLRFHTCTARLAPIRGIKISHIPAPWRSRMGWRRPSQLLKSPITETRLALGAQTAKDTPAMPSWTVGTAPNRSAKLPVTPFRKKILVRVAEHRSEAIGIFRLLDASHPNGCASGTPGRSSASPKAAVPRCFHPARGDQNRSRGLRLSPREIRLHRPNAVHLVQAPHGKRIVQERTAKTHPIASSRCGQTSAVSRESKDFGQAGQTLPTAPEAMSAGWRLRSKLRTPPFPPSRYPAAPTRRASARGRVLPHILRGTLAWRR